jgi:hypothetical protein
MNVTSSLVRGRWREKEGEKGRRREKEREGGGISSGLAAFVPIAG